MAYVALTIAGSDPSGGAGIQADLKTFHQHGVYGESVITLLTVQNTQTVESVKILDPDFVLKQLKAVIDDIPPQAAKTGALGGPEIIDALSSRIAKFEFPLVVDPVMISKHGKALLDSDGCELMKKVLLKNAYLVTPNLHEAQVLSEREITDEVGMEKAAISINKLGAKNVLVKGGHLSGDCLDILLSEGQIYRFPASHIETRHTHGTGCVYSAAITARIAKRENILSAVKSAKTFINEAIKTNPGLGKGQGPVNIFASAKTT